MLRALHVSEKYMKAKGNLPIGMAIFGSTLAFVILAVLLVGLGKIDPQESKKQMTIPLPLVSPDAFTVDTSKWLTYYNALYTFELKYPSDWKVFEGELYGVPVINVYTFRVGEDLTLPLAPYSGKTHISIFPKGLQVEEGSVEKLQSSVFSLNEETLQADDYVLSNGKPWASRLVFKSSPQTWTQSGFVWAEVTIKNQRSVCKRTDGLPCVPDDPQNVLQRSGVVRIFERQQEEKILSSFRFVEYDVKGAPPLLEGATDSVLFEIHESWGPCPVSGLDTCRDDSVLYASGRVVRNKKSVGVVESSAVLLIKAQLTSRELWENRCTPVYGPDRYESYRLFNAGVSKDIGEFGCQELQSIVRTVKSVPSVTPQLNSDEL